MKELVVSGQILLGCIAGHSNVQSMSVCHSFITICRAHYVKHVESAALCGWLCDFVYVC